MSYKAIQGYVLVVITGIVLLAAGILIILQWGNPAEFSLYGKNYSVRTIDGQVSGGVNTALLMLFSAVGGVVLWFCLKLLFRSGRAIRRSHREDQAKEDSRRIDKLEKAGGEQNT